MDLSVQLQTYSIQDVEFIKSEHQQVLKGLYQEIDRLQKKCTELQFAACSFPRENSVKEEFQVSKEPESIVRLPEVSSFQHLLREKNLRIKHLEELATWREAEYSNRTSAQELKIRELQRLLRKKDLLEEEEEKKRDLFLFKSEPSSKKSLFYRSKSSSASRGVSLPPIFKAGTEIKVETPAIKNNKYLMKSSEKRELA